MLSNRGPRILEAYTDNGAEVLSRLDIFVKDMGIVGKATRAAGLAAPVAAAAEQLYLLGQAQGLAAADDSAVIKVVAPTKRTAYSPRSHHRSPPTPATADPSSPAVSSNTVHCLRVYVKGDTPT